MKTLHRRLAAIRGSVSFSGDRVRAALQQSKPVLVGLLRHGASTLFSKSSPLLHQMVAATGEAVLDQLLARDDTETDPLNILLSKYLDVDVKNMVHLDIAPSAFLAPSDICKYLPSCLPSSVTLEKVYYRKRAAHKLIECQLSSLGSRADGIVYLLLRFSEQSYMLAIELVGAETSAAFDVPDLRLFAQSDSCFRLLISVIQEALTGVMARVFEGGAFLLEGDDYGRLRLVPLRRNPDPDYLTPARLETEAAWLKEVIASSGHYQTTHLKSSHGLILHGAPGTGKTSFVLSLLTNIPEATVFFISPQAANQHTLKKVSEVSEKLSSVVLVWDDCEKRMASRDEGADITEMLTFFDGFQKCPGLTQIAMTNRVDDLDEAFLRSGRFDRKVRVVKFTTEEKAHLARRMFRRHGVDYSAVDGPLQSFEYHDNAHYRGTLDRCIKKAHSTYPQSPRVTEEILFEARNFFNIYQKTEES